MARLRLLQWQRWRHRNDRLGRTNYLLSRAISAQVLRSARPLSGMQVELVTIGDELLLGFTIDTNAAYISRTLAEAGVEIVRRTTVGDEADKIAIAVREALERTGAVITTGGLGPTSDDLTKPSIAGIFGRKMVLDEEIAASLERRWLARFPGGRFPATNRAQAEIPEGAGILTNRHGSAPGIWLEDEKRRWVAMIPGVPREMRGMLAEEVLPRVRALLGDAESAVVSGTLRTTGIADRKSTRLNSSHRCISYAVFCLKKKNDT